MSDPTFPINNPSSFDPTTFREAIEESFQLFNRIALNPFEKISLPKKIYTGLPISWNTTQLYYNLLHYYEKSPFPHILIIVVDDSFTILDGFVINTELISEPDDTGTDNSFLECEVVFPPEFNEKEMKSEFFTNLQAQIKNFSSIVDITQSYFQKEYKYPQINHFVVPLSLRSSIKHLKLPSVNTNTMRTLSRILSWKGEILKLLTAEPRNPYAYMLSQCFPNPAKFDNLIKTVGRWNDVDIFQWSTIITTLLDDLVTNILIVSEDHKKLLFGAKISVDNNRMSIASLPNYLFKNLLTKSKTPLEIAKSISEHTGLRTQIMESQVISKYIKQYQQTQMGMFDFFSILFEIVFSSNFYPDSLLNAFLKLFGLELGAGISQFSEAFKTVTRYFGRILIATYQDNSVDKSRPYEALVEMQYEDGKYFMHLLNTQDYQQPFREPSASKIDHLKKIKEAIEEKNKVHYSGCFGFDINLLSEYLSAKNIQALLKMTVMAHQLPFIATLGALFVGMKGMKADQMGDPLIKLHDESPSDVFLTDRMEIQNYFDGFLKNGILFIGDEDKAMERIRSPEFSQDGSLGIDMEALRKFFKNSNH
ncbi:MAG: hypothetical protein ACTSYU_00480 [Promethearchaeota archaeon]